MVAVSVRAKAERVLSGEQSGRYTKRMLARDLLDVLDVLRAVAGAAEKFTRCSRAPGYTYRMEGGVPVVLPCECGGCTLRAAVDAVKERQT